MHVELLSRDSLINLIETAVITAWNITPTYKNHDSIDINKHNTRYFTFWLEIQKQEIIKRAETDRNEKKRKRGEEVK